MNFVKGKNHLDFWEMWHLQWKRPFGFCPQQRLRTDLWQWSGGKTQQRPAQCRVFKEIIEAKTFGELFNVANREKMGTEIDSLSCPKIRHPDFSLGIRLLNISFHKANRLFQGMAGTILGTFIH